MPYVSQVAVGKREKLTIFGKDYDTPDGTCRRDFIHVTDLAKGHVKAVEYAMKTTGTEVFNMGTGTPYSVLEIVKAFHTSSARDVRGILRSVGRTLPKRSKSWAGRRRKT